MYTQTSDRHPTMKTLFLAWQDPGPQRAWYPVGRLDADVQQPLYRFRYVKGAESAQRKSGFMPLPSFPELDVIYESKTLFPTFQNRVLNPKREEFHEYLRSLDLPENADPIMILGVSGGKRQTDNFEVFPKVERSEDGRFCCRFFLHGWRHINDSAKDRLQKLKPDEELRVSIELNNPATELAVQIQTIPDYYMIGWTPRYLVEDLMEVFKRGYKDITSKVIRVTPMNLPLPPSYLIDLSGNWPSDYESMSSDEFKVLSL